MNINNIYGLFHKIIKIKYIDLFHIIVKMNIKNIIDLKNIIVKMNIKNKLTYKIL